MKASMFFLIIALLVVVSTGHAYAAKKYVKPATSAGTSGGAATSGSYSRVSLFPSKLGLNVNFFNLGNISKVSYVLSYFGSNQSQGIIGSFAPSTPTDGRELLFGTCSHGACRYHENVKDARLVINFTLKNGLVVTKRYKVIVHK